MFHSFPSFLESHGLVSRILEVKMARPIEKAAASGKFFTKNYFGVSPI